MTLDLPLVYAQGVRVLIVTAFVLLAIALPPILEVRARVGRAREARELGVLVWLIFAAGIASTLSRWTQPLLVVVTALRLGVVIVGVHYVWRNRRVLR